MKKNLKISEKNGKRFLTLRYFFENEKFPLFPFNGKRKRKRKRKNPKLCL